MSNNTITTEYVGWVSAPDRRGTINIIWSCLSVLLICSYQCLHLNIPDDREMDAGWHKLCKACPIPIWPRRPVRYRYLRKLSMMCLIILAPEIGTNMALWQYGEARGALKRAKALGKDFDSWVGAKRMRTIEGKQRRYDNFLDKEGNVNKARYGDGGTGLTMAHAFYANMGGFSKISLLLDESDGSLRRTRNIEHHLTLEHYVNFLEGCAPDERRDVFVKSEADIQELGKSSTLVKILAIAQSLYLVIDCCVRLGRKLPISLLEVSTAAYVVPAATMYGLWWDKPFDAAHVTLLLGGPPTERPAVPEPEGSRTASSCWDPSYHLPDNFLLYAGNRASNYDDAINLVADFGWQQGFLCAVAAAFGGVHIAAWNAQFGAENDAPRQMWRALSIAITALPVVILLVMWTGSYGETEGSDGMARIKPGSFASRLLIWTFSTIIGAYALARLVILGLIVYSLTHMPQGVYDTTWAGFFPSIG